ncbi:MAG TPA: glycosyltransferase family 2 protein [Chloroflexota bacterium]|nr:glycosyltransferase family 2 protein [Chloroflexota bacterium]
MAQASVCVIIVSYRVRELLRQCLTSLRVPENAVDIAEVIVVDNGSGDGTVEMIREQFPEVSLIENPANPGFGAANNLAIKAAGRDYILFLNPDTVVASGAPRRLREHLTENTDTGVVGPRLRFPDGQTQSTRRRFPTILTALLESTVAERWRPNSRTVRRYRMDDRGDDCVQDADWLVGACLMTRKAVIDEVGGFDERFFMYSEELDWCRRVRAAGWRVTYLPAAEVIHYEGKSSEQNLARRAVIFNESKCRYFEKYYGRRVGLALRLYLLANTAYDLIVELSKFCFGHKHQLRRARVAALARVARAQTQQLVARASGR